MILVSLLVVLALSLYTMRTSTSWEADSDLVQFISLTMTVTFSTLSLAGTLLGFNMTDGTQLSTRMVCIINYS